MDMARPIFTPQDLTASPRSRIASAVVAAGAALGTFVLLGALALWVHYGTAVFFEMIASGLSACF